MQDDAHGTGLQLMSIRIADQNERGPVKRMGERPLSRPGRESGSPHFLDPRATRSASRRARSKLPPSTFLMSALP